MVTEIKDYKDIEIPETLYKYRDWSNDWHKTILTKNEIYLAPPKSFADKLDCKVPIRYDLLTNEEIFKEYFKKSREENIHFTRQQHRKHAKDWFRKGLMKNKNHLKQVIQNYFKKLDKQLGVLSLTANPVNMEMWQKYGNNHKGFCLGFNGKKLLGNFNRFGGGGDVMYYDKLPIIHPNDSTFTKSMLNIYSKLKKWRFEQEYRTSKLNLHAIDDSWRTVPVDVNFFKEIIIGAKMDEKDKDTILGICKVKFPFIKVFKTNIQNGNIVMSRLT